MQATGAETLRWKLKGPAGVAAGHQEEELMRGERNQISPSGGENSPAFLRGLRVVFCNPPSSSSPCATA